MTQNAWISRVRWMSLTLGAGLLASCAQTTTVRVQIQGNVTDVFGAPLEGIMVTLGGLPTEETEETVETDANGVYRFETDAIGTFPLTFQGEGFARHVTTVSNNNIPAVDDGDFRASAVRNVTLYRLDGTLEGRITRARGPSGPVEGLEMHIEITDSSVVDPALPRTVQTDETGRYRVPGLPAGANIRLYVPSFDTDGDGSFDTAGTIAHLLINVTGVTNYDLALDDFRGVEAIWSNANDAVLAPDASLEVVFSVPMETDPAQSQITLQQTSPRNFTVFTESSWSEDRTTLTITPAAPMTAGASYQLSIQARAADDGRSSSAYFSFQIATPDEGPPAPTDLRPAGDITYDQVDVTLEWIAVDEADGYVVFMKGMGTRVTDWIQVSSLAAPAGTTVTHTVNVPIALRNSANRVFDEGGSVLVAVASQSGEAIGPLSSPVTLKDDSCPRILSITQSGTFDNSVGGSPLAVTFTVYFSEPVQRSPAPMVDFTSGTLAPGDFSSTWVSDTQLRFAGEVPASTDGRVTIEVSAPELLDLSGNAICDGGDSITYPTY